MIGYLRSSTGLIKAIGSWMMMFAGIGSFIYLTESEMVSTIIRFPGLMNKLDLILCEFEYSLKSQPY